MNKNIRNSGQVLLFVFMLLLFLGIIVSNLLTMWRSGLESFPRERDYIIAFFCAQSGIERAVVELSLNQTEEYVPNNVNASLGSGNYSIIGSVSSGGGPKTKTIVSTGRCGNAEVRVSFALPKNPAGGPPKGNAWGYWRHFDNTWHYE